MSKNLTCQECDGKCCKYIVIEIDIPETEKDFEEIKWFVCHRNVFVYIDEDGSWNVEFVTPCRYLNKEHKCEIYGDRPDTCKEYSQDSCPFHNIYKEIQRFEKPEDVDEYVEKVFRKGLHVISEGEEEED